MTDIMLYLVVPDFNAGLPEGVQLEERGPHGHTGLDVCLGSMLFPEMS